MPQQKGCTPWNEGLTVGLTDYHASVRRAHDEVFKEESCHPRHRVKKRLIDEGLIEYTCNICGIGPEWNGKEMPLILDHINGVNNDNRIENLRFVCSNCDSQLPTYKSRNRRGG